MDPQAEPSLETLIGRALKIDDEEDHAYWEIVTELQRRGDQSTFDAMAQLCVSTAESSRRLGLNVLAQLGFETGRPFLEASLPIVTRFCQIDMAEAVLVDAVAALGHLHDIRGLEPVLRVVEHDSDQVRMTAAMALPHVAGEPPDERAVEALIRLSDDDDPSVRDWATFGLGSQLEVDSPPIRDALLARIEDVGGDTMGEAMVGLAARGDLRIFDRLAAVLSGPEPGNLMVEAAARLGDPRLLPALYALREASWGQDDPRGEWLSRAISACEDGSPVGD